MEELREELEEIKYKLTDIIPKLEAEGLDQGSIVELQEAKIVIGGKIQEMDIM